jgi:hypothetical protein
MCHTETLLHASYADVPYTAIWTNISRDTAIGKNIKWYGLEKVSEHTKICEKVSKHTLLWKSIYTVNIHPVHFYACRVHILAYPTQEVCVDNKFKKRVCTDTYLKKTSVSTYLTHVSLRMFCHGSMLSIGTYFLTNEYNQKPFLELEYQFIHYNRSIIVLAFISQLGRRSTEFWMIRGCRIGTRNGGDADITTSWDAIYRQFTTCS